MLESIIKFINAQFPNASDQEKVNIAAKMLAEAYEDPEYWQAAALWKLFDQSNAA